MNYAERIYCYAKGGNYGLKQQYMSFETGEKAINFFNKNFEKCNIHLTFFGGEPLLNYKVMIKICEYAKSLESENRNTFNFGIVTNGTILNTEIIKAIEKYNIGLVISIDGPKYIHDVLRKYKSGKGSYDIIAKNIRLLQNLHIPIAYEATYTLLHEKNNISEEDLTNFFTNELHLNMGFIVDVSYPLLERKKPSNFNDSLEEFFHNKLNDDFLSLFLSYFVYKIKNNYACSLGKRHFSVTPNGEIFPCHILIGISKFYMGNVKSKKLDENFSKVQKMLYIFDHSKNDKCKSCWARYLCKDCPAQRYLRTNKLEIPSQFCKNQQKKFEKALIKISKLKSNPDNYNSFIYQLKKKNEMLNYFKK